MDGKNFMAVMHRTRLLSTFGPDFKDELTIDAWYSALRHIPDTTLLKALDALKGGREFPSLQDILALCKDLSNMGEREPDVAFAYLWKKIGEIGGRGQPELPNEIGLAVERLGGWYTICNSWTEKEKPWHQKAFKEAYQDIIRQKQQGTLSQTSKYALGAPKNDRPKQLPTSVGEALKKAVEASERGRPKLRDFLKTLKDDNEQSISEAQSSAQREGEKNGSYEETHEILDEGRF